MSITNKSKASLGKRCDGSLSIVTDSIQTSEAYQITSTSGWRIGPSSVLGTTSILSASTTYGTYTVTGGWTSNASTHNINPSAFCLNTSNIKVLCSFTIYCSDKANGGTRFGIIQGHYFRPAQQDDLAVDQWGNIVGATYAASWYTISTTKSSGLSTFSALTTNGIVQVSTDSNCRICWRADCAI